MQPVAVLVLLTVTLPPWGTRWGVSSLHYHGSCIITAACWQNCPLIVARFVLVAACGGCVWCADV